MITILKLLMDEVNNIHTSMENFSRVESINKSQMEMQYYTISYMKIVILWIY